MADDDLEMDDELGGDEESAPEKKGGMMKLIIIAVAALLVLGGGGAAAYFFLFADDQPAQEEEKTAQDGAAKEGEAKEGDKAKAEAPGTILNMEPFIVNLADPSGKRYLKLTLAVDAKDEAMKADIEARLPQIRDSILLLLTSKTFEEISTVAGKLRLKNEVLKIINRSLGGQTTVHAVYFTEFVIQ